jgi:hypothetical protein
MRLLFLAFIVTGCTATHKYKKGDCIKVFPEDDDYVIVEDFLVGLDNEWYSVSFNDDSTITTTIEKKSLEEIGTKVQCIRK